MDLYLGKKIFVYVITAHFAGNILSFAVLSQKAMKPPPTYLYLTVLSVVDVIALYIPCLHGWMNHLTRGDVNLMQILGCSW